MKDADYKDDHVIFDYTDHVEEENFDAKIKVIGVGGGGGNAVRSMVEQGISGVEFVIANTDAQALRCSPIPQKLQIGKLRTKGLGAGGKPEVGQAAAQDDTEAIRESISGADMVFVTAGMGGGTGTGAAPIIASIAKEMGALTVGVVTKPFTFEGKKRMRNADNGLREFRKSVDTLITIPNQQLLSFVGKNTPLAQAFTVADDVLCKAVKGISEVITAPGLINLDFADVKTIMGARGMALMGAGMGTGEDRAVEAAQNAINNPLLEDSCIDGAHGILINITGGPDLTLYEINEAASHITNAASHDAEIIFGAVVDERMGEKISVTVIATGFRSNGEVKGTEELREIKESLAPLDRENLRAVISENMNAIESNSTPPEGTPRRNVLKAVNSDIVHYEDDLDVPTFLRRHAD